MNDDTHVLDFVKAVSDADRLRIIGVLAQRPSTTSEVAASLGMPFRQVFNHLGLLEFAGVIRRSGDLFSLNDAALETLSREKLGGQHESYVPAPDLDPATRKVLSANLNADGSLKQLPAQPAKMQIVLAYLAASFEPDREYTEKEVNLLLRRFHPDTAALRRALVDAGLLARESDGSRYWRTPRLDPPLHPPEE
jgi:hypothetical protein